MKKAFTLLSSCLVLGLSAQKVFEQARLFIDQDQNAKAASILDSCFARSYFADSALYYKSILLLKEHKPEKAAQLADRLEHEYSTFNDVHYLYGMISFENQDYAKSIEHFNRALQLSPRHVKALVNRAVAEAALEDYETALTDLTQAIEISPANPELYYSRAYWLNVVGRTDEAIGDFNKSIELNPKNYDAYLALAQIYHLRKDILKACESVERAAVAGSQIAADLKAQYCGDH